MAKQADSWASSAGNRASMQGNRSRDTKPELVLRRAVFALGLRYRVAYRPLRQVRRSADLAFTRVKVAVFLDGCFWHGCPEHYTKPKTNAEFWAKKYSTNRARDRQTDQLLKDAGWTTIRIWEHEDLLAAAARIAVEVERRRSVSAVR